MLSYTHNEKGLTKNTQRYISQPYEVPDLPDFKITRMSTVRLLNFLKQWEKDIDFLIWQARRRA